MNIVCPRCKRIFVPHNRSGGLPGHKVDGSWCMDDPCVKSTSGTDNAGPGAIVPHTHVRIDADVFDGRPYVIAAPSDRVALHTPRVPVRRIWAWHRAGASIETLIKRYPDLGPARILDALAFAYDNQELIDCDIDRERQESIS